MWTVPLAGRKREESQRISGSVQLSTGSRNWTLCRRSVGCGAFSSNFPRVQRVQKTVELPQVQPVDKVVDVFVSVQFQLCNRDTHQQCKLCETGDTPHTQVQFLVLRPSTAANRGARLFSKHQKKSISSQLHAHPCHSLPTSRTRDECRNE